MDLPQKKIVYREGKVILQMQVDTLKQANLLKAQVIKKKLKCIILV